MAENSGIQWTHHTFNPWRGCTKISDGCKNCYADTLSHRNPKALGIWGPNGTRPIASEAYWRQPLRWNAQAEAAGVRTRVFCASLADVFEEREELAEPRMRLFQLIGQTPHLDWLLLTKRPQVAVEHWPLWCGYWCSVQTDTDLMLRVANTFVLPNVWRGTSVENQQTADERIPHLLRCAAAVRFLSCEPLLGAVDLCAHVHRRGAHYKTLTGTGWMGPAEPKLHWVIAGGESGPNARPMHPDWARSLRDQCQAAGLPFFFKQCGEWAPGEVAADHLNPERSYTGKSWFNDRWVDVVSMPDTHRDDEPEVYRVGKKAAGRLLDGLDWSEFPKAPVTV